MPEAQVVEWIREKYVAIVDDLDGRGGRRWAGAEARSLGWGVWPRLPKLPASLTEQSVRGLKSLMIPTQRLAIDRDVRAVVADPVKSNTLN